MISNEKRPPHAPEELVEGRQDVNKITPEALIQNENEAELQRKNVEKLIAVEVDARSDWSQRNREYMAGHLRGNYGQWRECDGDYVRFVGFYPDFKKRIIEAVFDAYGQDMADEIPMPDWMQSPED